MDQNDLIREIEQLITVDTIFEENNQENRDTIKQNIIDKFEEYKEELNIVDYVVICDETNNTAESINNFELIVDVYVKFTEMENFHLWNFVYASTGVLLEELEGRISA